MSDRPSTGRRRRLKDFDADLPRLAQHLDGMDVSRLRRRVFWAGNAILIAGMACFGATAITPLWFWDSLASIEVLGWPLVALGAEPHGWISFGSRPTGLVAIGEQPTGVIAVGAFPIGLVSVGAFALGLFSFGPAAVGVVSYGVGGSVGCISFGHLCCLGWYAHGQAACGAYAWGNHRVRGLRFERRLSSRAFDF